MSVRQDRINLIVEVNGDTAQDQLNQLRKRSADLNAEMKGLKKGTAEWIAKSNELKEIDKQMVDLRGSIGLTALSQRELQAELRRLQQLKNVATPQTKEFKELQEQIDAVTDRLKDVKAGKFGFKSWLADIKDEVKQFGMLAGSYLGFEFLTSQVSNIIGAQAKLEDSLADVRKTTGLTTDEVKSLNSELGKIDTRTSSAHLREMAAVAGQFGIAKKDILGFVDAADKVNVALGDEFGGNAEAVATDMIKLRNIFTDIKTDKVDVDMLHVANALNELGNAGAATAPVVADFSNRIGGIGIPLGLTTAQVLGLSGTLQELNVSTERGGTAIGKILQKMTVEAGTFATIAGQDVTSFSELMNRDLFGAFVKVVEGSQKSGASATAMASLLKDAELQGAGASEVFLKLAANTDMLAGKVDLAGVALKSTNSIQEEFNVKNNNFAATVEKLSKELNKMITSDSVNRFVKSATAVVESFMRTLPQVLGFIQQNIAAFALWGLAYASQIGWVQKAVAWIKLQTTALAGETVARKMHILLVNAEIVATSLLSAAKAILAGNFTKARQELQLMTAAMGTNPFTAMLVVVGLLIVGVNQLVYSMGQLTEVQKLTSDITKQVNTSVVDYQSKVMGLMKTVNNLSLSEEVRKVALKDLQQLMPAHLKNLTLEQAGHRETAIAIGEHILSLKRLAFEEAIAEKRKAMMTKVIDANSLAQDAENKIKGMSAAGKLWGATRSNTWLDGGEDNPFNQRQKAADDLKAAQEGLKMLDGTMNAYQMISGRAAAATQAGATATTKAIIATGKQTVAQKRAILKQEIEQLKAGYEMLAFEDAAGRKKMEADIAAKETELNAIGGKPGSGGKALAKARVEAKRVEALEIAAAAKLKKLKEDVGELRDQLTAAAVSEDAKEVQRVTQKYADLLQRAKGHLKEEADLTALQKQELDQLLEKQAKKHSEAEYVTRLGALNDYYQSQRSIADTAFAAGETSLSQHAAEMARIDQWEAADRLTIAKDAAADSVKAQDDLEKAKTALAKNGVETRKNTDARTAAEAMSEAERKVITAKTGTAAQLAAQKAHLELKAQQELAAAGDLAEKRKAIEAQLARDLAAADKAFIKQKADEWINVLNAMGAVASSFIQGINDKENVGLDKEQKANEKKKAGYKAQLDSKRISQKQYDSFVEKADADLEAKKLEVARRQAVREKSLALFSIALNTAQAVMSIWAQVPKFDFGVSAGVLTAAAIGLGAVQAGMVLAKDPPMGRRGLFIDGPSHEAGGIDMVNTQTGERLANIEGGEAVMVLNKDTTKANGRLIADLMASSAAGRGARVKAMDWYQKPGPQLATSSILPQMRRGGVLSSTNTPLSGDYSANSGSGGGTLSPDFTALMERFISEQQQTREVFVQMPKELRARVLLQDIHDSEDELSKVKSIAGIRQ